jgi:hypothetical protein
MRGMAASELPLYQHGQAGLHAEALSLRLRGRGQVWHSRQCSWDLCATKQRWVDVRQELPSQASSKVARRASDERISKSYAPGNAKTFRDQCNGRKQLWPQNRLWKEEFCVPGPAKEHSVRLLRLDAANKINSTHAG